MIQELLDQYEYIVRTSHMNAIAAAAYIVFGQPNNLDMRAVRENIYNGSFGELDVQTQNILEREKVDFGYDMFNIVVLVIIQSIGFDVLHPDMSLRSQKIQKINNQLFRKEKIIMSSQTLCHGKSMFISEISDTLAYDWPIYMILKALKIMWQPNDVAYNTVVSVMTQYSIKKNVFLVDENAARASACCIASQLQKKDNPQIKYYVDTGKSLSLAITSEDQPCFKYLDTFMERVCIVDMEDRFYTQFCEKIIDGLKNKRVILV